MKRTNLIRLLTIVSLFVLLALPLSAQEKQDTVFKFRFFPKRNMFYSPILDNGDELKRLFDFVDRYKKLISDRKIYLHVDGYCNSKKTKAQCLALAKIRSNRVKSELITRKGLKEHNFVTHNHYEDGDYVVLCAVVSKKDLLPVTKEQPEVREPEPVAPLETEITEEEIEVVIPDESQTETEVAPVVTEVEPVDPDSVKKEVVWPDQPSEDVCIGVVSYPPQSGLREERPDSRFLLKTNLLMYGILMPNIEFEWKFADKWSAAIEGQRAWYAKNSPHKVYRVATVTPEVRYWPIERSRWHGMYVGVFGGSVIYDLSKGKKGHEGEGFMTGVSAGYMWPIGKHLSLDAGIGLGYLRTRDKVYLPYDGHFLYQYTQNVNYFGPLRLKLSLVWRIQGKKIIRENENY